MVSTQSGERRYDERNREPDADQKQERAILRFDRRIDRATGLTMTLDLARVGTQLHEMSTQLRASRGSRALRLEQARTFFRELADDWERIAEEARRGAGSWAAPLEPLDAVHRRPPTPSTYEVLATDGSTIEPDRHGPALCALINVGRVRIRYGDGPAAQLDSQPTLYFRPEQLYVRQGERRVLLGERLLDAQRSVAEMDTLSQLGLDTQSSGVPQVALADGLLTIWRQDWAAADADTVTATFRQALDTIADRNVPLAAYVSNPHSHWVVDLVRQQAHCAAGGGATCALHCPADECAVDGLLDVDLFDLLQPGDRSCLFEVVGRDADRYGEQHRSHFCYLHVGSEVARLELPRWAARDPQALDLIHAVVCDQAERGLGYPVALARAHEQAVLAAGDRRAFRQMIVEALVRAGLPADASEKQLSKNLRAV